MFELARPVGRHRTSQCSHDCLLQPAILLNPTNSTPFQHAAIPRAQKIIAPSRTIFNLPLSRLARPPSFAVARLSQ